MPRCHALLSLFTLGGMLFLREGVADGDSWMLLTLQPKQPSSPEQLCGFT